MQKHAPPRSGANNTYRRTLACINHNTTNLKDLMKKILILITIVAFSSCKSGPKKYDDNKGNDLVQVNDENEFKKYISLIPLLELPYVTSCENCCNHSELDDNDPLIRKFKPEGSSIVGLIQKNDERIVLLVTYPADQLVPSVKVYDPNGRLSDEMNFMTNLCGEDFEFLNRSQFIISKDLTFQTFDTAYYFKLDTASLEIIDTISTEITIKAFCIDGSGKLIEK